MPINGQKKQPIPVVKPSVDTSTLNSSYSNLASNNPYENMQYTQSFWDKVRGFLGFRTDAQKFEDEMYNNAQLYNAQLLQAQREEEYNSASEQAQRMREAGINPDLQSGSISAGDATEFDNQSTEAPETPNTDEQHYRESMNMLGRSIQGVFGIATQVLGMLKDSSGILSSLFGIEQSNVNSFAKYTDWAKSYLRQNVFGDSTRFTAKYDKDGNFTGWEDAGFDNFDIKQQLSSIFSQWTDFDAFDKDEEMRTRFPTRTARKRAWYEMKRVYKDPEFLNELYQTLNSYHKERRSLNETRSSGFWSPSDNSQMDVLKPLVKLSDEILRLQYQIDRYGVQATYDYWKNVQHSESSRTWTDENGVTHEVRETQKSIGELKAEYDKSSIDAETQGQNFNWLVNRLFYTAGARIQERIENSAGAERFLYETELMLLNNLRSENLIQLGSDMFHDYSNSNRSSESTTITESRRVQ